MKELHSSLAQMGEPAGKTTVSAFLHKSRLYGRVARQKLLLRKRQMTACQEFAKKHVKDSESMRQKILWFDETKIKFFVLNAKCCWHWCCTFQNVTHGEKPPPQVAHIKPAVLGHSSKLVPKPRLAGNLSFGIEITAEETSGVYYIVVYVFCIFTMSHERTAIILMMLLCLFEVTASFPVPKRCKCLKTTKRAFSYGKIRSMNSSRSRSCRHIETIFKVQMKDGMKDICIDPKAVWFQRFMKCLKRKCKERDLKFSQGAERFKKLCYCRATKKLFVGKKHRGCERRKRRHRYQ
uniref:C-C motif chemokine 13 n=1 Tax=Myxine glutinosa TaxID=7769 RepID=UPI00358ED883